MTNSSGEASLSHDQLTSVQRWTHTAKLAGQKAPSETAPATGAFLKDMALTMIAHASKKVGADSHLCNNASSRDGITTVIAANNCLCPCSVPALHSTSNDIGKRPKFSIRPSGFLQLMVKSDQAQRLSICSLVGCNLQQTLSTMLRFSNSLRNARCSGPNSS